MIIKKMTLTNFFRYKGDQIIDFSIKDGKNVIILRGENGSGKTTLLNAFLWVLYGDVMEPLKAENMLNYNTIHNMQEGEIKKSSVEIQFEDKEITYFIKRGQKFIKRDNVVECYGEKIFSITYEDDNGNPINVDNIDEFFEGIIPKKLRGFFFFDGERINRLAQIDGKEEIKEAILNILGLITLENMDKDLNNIGEELLEESKKYLGDSEKKITEERKYKIEEKELKEAEKSDLQHKIKKCDENFETANKYLINHNIDKIKERQNERVDLENKQDNLKEQIEKKRKELLAHISKNFKTKLIMGKFSEVRNILEEKRKKGELPSDIKKQFIEDLINRKRCICGRSLIEGTEEFSYILQLKKVAGITELDDAYSRLIAYIKYTEEEEEFYDTYYNILKEIDVIHGDIDIIGKKLENIRKEFEKHSEDTIVEYEKIRELAKQERSKLLMKLGIVEKELEVINNEISRLDKQIEHMKVYNEEAQKILLQRNVVNQLKNLNTEIKSFFIENTRKNLDAKIKEVYKKISRKEYRVPELNENFELKVKNTLIPTDDSAVLSTGEGQITSLSFIGALVAYSKQKSTEGLLSDFSGGDFPIFMDSPFGNLDDIHTANVAANIGKLASQVIIVVSDKQWSNTVSDNIFNQVSRMYIMKDGDFKENNAGEYTLIEEVIL